jgi:hypothetical protein
MAFEAGDAIEIASELLGLSLLPRDATVFREHTLALSPYPRMVPEYFDDTEVSEVLHWMAAHIRLPWLIAESTFDKVWFDLGRNLRDDDD